MTARPQHLSRRDWAYSAVALLILLGTPALLLWTTTIPGVGFDPQRLSEQLRTAPADLLLLSVVQVTVAALWLHFLLCLAVEARPAARRTGLAPSIPGGGLNQTLARCLVLTIVSLISLAGQHGEDPGTTPAPPAAAEAAISMRYTPVASEHRLAHYVVRPGDTLWDIAEQQLGSWRRYPEIHRLNHGRRQPHGGVYLFAGFIRPGWDLLLPPADQAPRVTTTPPNPATKTSHPQPIGRTPAAHTTREDEPDHAAIAPHAPTPPAAGDHADDSTDRCPIVTLPDGSVIALSVITGMTAAASITTLLRRRRYTPRRPRPRSPIGDTPPPPPPPGLSAPRDAATVLGEPDDLTAPASELVVPWLYAGHFTNHPGRLTIAHHNQQPVAVDLLADGPLALDGPDPAGVARAVVAGLVAEATPLSVTIWCTDPAVSAQLAGDDPPEGLRTFSDDSATMDALEAELIRRGRLHEGHNASSFADYRQENPDDAIPLLVVISHDTLTDVDRWQALLAAGRTFGVTAIHLGPTPPGAAVSLAFDADYIVDDGPVPPGLGGATLFHLNVADTRHALAVTYAALHDPVINDDEPDSPIVDVAGHEEPEQQLHEPYPELTAVPPAQPPAQPPSQPASLATLDSEDEVVSATPPRRLRVSLLGTLQISVDGEPIRTGLFKAAREILAFFLLHPRGATMDTAAAFLWPDTDPDKISTRWWNNVNNLRTTLRAALGDEQLQVLIKDGPLYRIEDNLLDLDLDTVEHAFTAAQQAHDTHAEQRWLERVGQTYQGDLLAGLPYEWVEPLRFDLRRRTLDALARLATLHRTQGRTAQAVQVLEQAITIDPYAEEFYRQAMQMLMTAGEPERARRLYRQLSERLAELDAEPDDVTEQILHQPDAANAALT